MEITAINRKIVPSKIAGSVGAPPSKSMMIRAIVAGLLAKGKTIIRNPSFCDDAIAAIEVAKGLGAIIEVERESVIIQGGNDPVSNSLNCQESGLSIRMFSAVAALQETEIKLDGTGSLVRRPVDMLMNPLSDLGVSITTNNGFLPISIKGPLAGGKTFVDGSSGSQFLTGLLMSLPLVGANSEIIVNNLKSKPYIDMTIRILMDFDVNIEHSDYEVFTVKGKQKYKAREYFVEGDWSGAAFLLVAGAIGGEVEVMNLDIYSKQADIRIIEALEKAGAELNIQDNSIKVSRGNLRAFFLDITDCPDLAPPLVVLAAYCDGVTRLTGAKRLLIKESNRAKTLQQEFAKLGIGIEILDDEMFITGGSVGEGTVKSHGDHRIAMAAAIAALGAKGPVIIENAESVTKSWPDFFVDLKKIGGIIYE